MAGYVQSSTDFLYAGMVVPQPIYNADMSLVLVPEGIILTDARIEQLKRYNEGSAKICVSAATEKLLKKRRDELISAPLTQALEDEIGYSEIKVDAFEILERISHEESVSMSELTSVSEELSHTLESTAPSIIVDLVSALASADEYLQRHCVNVGMMNGLFGKWLGMPKENVDTLILVGLLHDCGKASMPNKILSAPRPLTLVEFEVIKTHPEFSGNLMMDLPEIVRFSARGHHEKINGTGYPDGLSGQNIPFMARITAVSDIYDAMVSRRSYKNSNSPFKILSIIDGLRGTELDVVLVDAFIQNMTREMTGKQVLLSDGRIGTVISIDPEKLEFPTIEVSGKTLYTNAGLSCVSLYYSEAPPHNLESL